MASWRNAWVGCGARSLIRFHLLREPSCGARWQPTKCLAGSLMVRRRRLKRTSRRCYWRRPPTTDHRPPIIKNREPRTKSTEDKEQRTDNPKSNKLSTQDFALRTSTLNFEP